MFGRSRTWTALAAAVAVVCATTAWAQGAAGTISGTIKDETGAIVPGATIVISNTETSLTRSIVSDGDGRYTAPNLPPGPYEISASLVGFTPVRRSGIRLTVGREAVVDLVLQLGTVQDEVVVVGEAPTIDTTSASTGALVSEEQIKGLPLNGRSYIELATTVPGVLLTEPGGRGTSTGFGQKISVSGARWTQNLFTLDGTMMNDQFNQAGSASGNLLGVEAVREFQVLNNSFSAEYGRHTGGVINAATKSGTNAFHGSVFEFHRNDALDAKNFFDRGEQPPFTRHQFGFSVGGPISRDRTFFFGTYEGLHERLGQTLYFTVPSEAVRRGTVHPDVRSFLESYPLPNGAAFGTTRGEYIRTSTRSTDEHYVMSRVDHQFSGSSTIFARYTFDDGQVEDPIDLHTGDITRTRMQYLTVGHTWLRGASWLNRLQFGFSRSNLDGYNNLLDGLTLPSTTFTDLTFGIGTITVTGLSRWGGVTTNPKQQSFSNYQLSDTVTWTTGPHSVRFGGTLEIQQYDLTSHFTSMGSFGFNSLDDFVANRPMNFAAMMPESDASRELRQAVFGFFVQDDIRLGSNFTLNVGLRYEPTTDITETQGRLAQLIDFASTTATFADTTVLDALVRNPSLKTLAPRLGFSWSPGGRTAVRGGIGVFYDLLTLNVPLVQNTAVRVPPFISRGGLIRGADFPFIDFPDAYFTQREAIQAQAALEGMQYDPDQSVMYKWNVNVQRELSPRTSVEVGYSGSRGVNLWRHFWTNGRVAVPNADGRLQVPAGQPLRQPNFERMSFRGTDGTSDYHGLTVGLTRRAGAGFIAQVSYTFSKSIDDGATSLGPLDFTNEGASGPRYLFEKDRGLSPHDLRHAFVASASYQLPFGTDGGAAAWLIRGWDVAGLVRLRSGYPFSVYTGIDQSQQVFAPRYPDLRQGADKNPILGDPNQYFDPTAFVLQPLGVIGNLGRNTLIGPGLATVDLNVSRQIAIGSGLALQLRIEVFNLLNRANFGLPSTNLFAANGTYLETAGRITTTATSARQVQIGAKFLW